MTSSSGSLPRSSPPSYFVFSDCSLKTPKSGGFRRFCRRNLRLIIMNAGFTGIMGPTFPLQWSPSAFWGLDSSYTICLDNLKVLLWPKRPNLQPMGLFPDLSIASSRYTIINIVISGIPHHLSSSLSCPVFHARHPLPFQRCRHDHPSTRSSMLFSRRIPPNTTAFFRIS